jgi:hypothetical protein
VLCDPGPVSFGISRFADLCASLAVLQSVLTPPYHEMGSCGHSICVAIYVVHVAPPMHFGSGMLGRGCRQLRHYSTVEVEPTSTGPGSAYSQTHPSYFSLPFDLLVSDLGLVPFTLSFTLSNSFSLLRLPTHPTLP